MCCREWIKRPESTPTVKAGKLVLNSVANVAIDDTRVGRWLT